MKTKKIVKPISVDNSKKLSRRVEVDSLNGPVKLSPAQKAHMISLNRLSELSVENRKNS